MYVHQLVLECSSSLPLHRLVAKLAACDTVTLHLSRDQRCSLQTEDNLAMLRQLSVCLVTPCIQYVQVRCSNDWPSWTKQLRALLSSAAHFTFHITDDTWSEDAHAVLSAELAAAKARSIRVDTNWRSAAALGTMTSLHATLTALDFRLNFEEWTNVESPMRVLQRVTAAVRPLPHLRALAISTRYESHELSSSQTKYAQSVMQHLLSLGATCSLDTLHIAVEPIVTKSIWDETVSASYVQRKCRPAMASWKATILSATVTLQLIARSIGPPDCTQRNVQVPDKVTTRQLLSDEVAAHLSANRTAVSSNVHRTLAAHHIDDVNIAAKVLQYVHQSMLPLATRIRSSRTTELMPPALALHQRDCNCREAGAEARCTNFTRAVRGVSTLR